MDYQMVLLFGKNEGNKSFFRIDQCIGAWRQHDEQKTGHMPEASTKETHILEKRYGIQGRKSLLGKLIRILYRLRRAYWYWKRGGMSVLAERFVSSLKTYSF
jgi:hypothetical protein